MAKVRSATFPERIEQALVDGLRLGGIAAQVQTEPVKGTKLWRVLVTSRQFEELRPSERQDLAWRIMDQSLSADEQLRISMILTLSPKELAGR